MFVLELTYTAPIEQVDELLGAHVEWLEALYRDGVVIASGRKNPRDGGVLLAVGDDRARVEELLKTDPFISGGVGGYRVTEFYATKTVPELAPYRQQLPGTA
ncbi:YciI family protein [Streptomyces sp. SCSIO 30461]|uniref:YciI family protein n=1 Tax=Streptomyces sp. SCSIO 30461 TaxID=3118085 RepID=UPI0030CEC8B9